MDGDGSCPWGRGDDVTGGGERAAFNTMETSGGHLGGVRGHRRRGAAASYCAGSGGGREDERTRGREFGQFPNPPVRSGVKAEANYI